jgi:hypothetical protein
MMGRQEMPTVHWESWLVQWKRELLARLDITRYNAFIEPDITPELVASGWLGYPGATEDQIVQLEARLGMTLPSSHRAFLNSQTAFGNPV